MWTMKLPELAAVSSFEHIVSQENPVHETAYLESFFGVNGNSEALNLDTELFLSCLYIREHDWIIGMRRLLRLQKTQHDQFHSA